MQGLDSLSAADLAEMWSLSSSRCAVKCLLCDVDVFTKYACVEPLKDKKVKTVLTGFLKQFLPVLLK